MKYYYIPSDDKGVFDADYRVLSEIIHFQQDTALIIVADNVIPRDTWREATETDWKAKQLGVSADPISIAKAQKTQELQQSSDQATAAFKSSALGSPHTYLADEKSMTFLAGEYSFVKSSDYDGSTTDWFTVEDDTFVTHTGVQIAQVFIDGRAWIKEQKTVKLKSLLVQVEQATTIEEVNAIVW
jgi:hypothetical protein